MNAQSVVEAARAFYENEVTAELKNGVRAFYAEAGAAQGLSMHMHAYKWRKQFPALSDEFARWADAFCERTVAQASKIDVLRAFKAAMAFLHDHGEVFFAFVAAPAKYKIEKPRVAKATKAPKNATAQPATRPAAQSASSPFATLMTMMDSDMDVASKARCARSLATTTEYEAIRVITDMKCSDDKMIGMLRILASV